MIKPIHLIRTAILGLLAVIAAGGCYSTGSLYRSDVQTVFVEMFESRSFRRQAEFHLTHAVCRQIEMQTPYRLSSDQNQADTILYGMITDISETVQAQQRDLDRPAMNRLTITATVSWKDLRSGEFLVKNQTFRFSSDYAALGGETADSAIRRVVNDMARQIVEIMETNW